MMASSLSSEPLFFQQQLQTRTTDNDMQPTPRYESEEGVLATTNADSSIVTHPFAILHHAAVIQRELDERRKTIEAYLEEGNYSTDSNSPNDIHPIVVKALKEGILRSILADREITRACMQGLLFGDVSSNITRLQRAQASQAEMLTRCEEALAWAPLVTKLERYLRDRNFPNGATTYCLDRGQESWVRIKTTKADLTLSFLRSASAPRFHKSKNKTTRNHEDRTKSEDKVCVVQKYFSAVLLEVTREVPLASINPDMRDIYPLIQPLKAEIVRLDLGRGDRDMKLIADVTSNNGLRFAVEAYGYKTHYRKEVYAEDDTLVRSWACGLPSSPQYQVPAARHLIGLQIPVPHELLTPNVQPEPLTVLLSIR